MAAGTHTQDTQAAAERALALAGECEYCDDSPAESSTSSTGSALEEERAAFVKHTLCTAVQHALVLPSSAPARRYPVSWRTCAGISPTVYVRSAHLFFCLRPSACLFVCLSRHNACAVCACVRALMRGWVCCAVFTRKCLANPEAFACLANQAPC